MAANLGYVAGTATVAFAMPDYYVWDSSVILVDGIYHMFASRWPKAMGFGSNWLFHSEIIHATSPSPEGPYTFQNVVLPRRGRNYFDGMNTHNTCIRAWGGKYYLYYMGTSYAGDLPAHADEIDSHRALEVWNRKRIGVAVADDINGPFIRQDTPLLEPRDPSHWDCTVTTKTDYKLCGLQFSVQFMEAEVLWQFVVAIYFKRQADPRFHTGILQHFCSCSYCLKVFIPVGIWC